MLLFEKAGIATNAKAQRPSAQRRFIRSPRSRQTSVQRWYRAREQKQDIAHSATLKHRVLQPTFTPPIHCMIVPSVRVESRLPARVRICPECVGRGRVHADPARAAYQEVDIGRSEARPKFRRLTTHASILGYDGCGAAAPRRSNVATMQ